MTLFQRIVIFSLAFCKITSVHARGIPDSKKETLLRERFILAEQALKNGDDETYHVLARQLTHYPLFPYLEYEMLSESIEQDAKSPDRITLETIQSFKERYPDLPVHKSLLTKWLTEEARQGRWNNYLKGYALIQNNNPTTGLRCYEKYANYQKTRNLESLKSSLSLWMVGHSQPGSCSALFKLMEKEGIIENKDIYRRIALSLEKKDFTLASHLTALLPKKQQLITKAWLDAAQNPKLMTRSKTLKLLKSSPYHNDIFKSLMVLYCKQNLNEAIDFVHSHLKELNLDHKSSDFIKQDIGIRLAQNKDAKALEWLAQVDKNHLNKTAKEWQIRLSLYNENWNETLAFINQLDKDQREQRVWQYWEARAKLKTGDLSGNAILQKLAQTRSYYGFLASEILHVPYNISHEEHKLTRSQIKIFHEHPVIQRVDELMDLERIAAAKKEWLHLLEWLDDPNKIVAAHVANYYDWHELAILAMSKSSHPNELSLRFPMAYGGLIKRFSSENNLDPAWVFALTRQESAFAYHVKSRAGALGLMQLMPTTAFEVAKRMNLEVTEPHEILEPFLNIHLGTTYLKTLNKSMKGQIILATASYNAGMGRVQKWLPKTPMDPDIWIENIPIFETREYVQNIITYMGIYKSRMGEPFHLSAVMQPVGLEKKSG